MLFTPATRPRPQQLFSAGLDTRPAAPPSRAEGGHRPLFALSAAHELGGGPFAAAPQSAAAAAPAEEPADARLPQQFAAALEHWFLQQEAPPGVVSLYLPLLEQYEALTASELRRAEERLRTHDSGPTSGAGREALQAECAMLRGERLTWRLLLDLYCGARASLQPPRTLLCFCALHCTTLSISITIRASAAT